MQVLIFVKIILNLEIIEMIYTLYICAILIMEITIMNDKELMGKIEELELISIYGEPAEAAQAAQELAKLKSSDLYKNFIADMDMDYGNFERGERVHTNGLEKSVQEPLRAKVQIYGKTHTSLHIDDALSTLGYTQADIQKYHRTYDNPTRKP